MTQYFGKTRFQIRVLLLSLICIIPTLQVYADYTIKVLESPAWIEKIPHPEEGFWDYRRSGDDYGPIEKVWVVTKQAWTEEIKHDAVYKEFTFTGERPADIENPSAADIANIKEELKADAAAEVAAQGLDPNSPEGKEKIQAILDSYQDYPVVSVGDIDKKEVGGYCEVFGDPVRLATGEFVVPPESDLSWK